MIFKIYGRSLSGECVLITTVVGLVSDAIVAADEEAPYHHKVVLVNDELRDFAITWTEGRRDN